MKINPFILALSASVFFAIGEILFKYIFKIETEIMTFTPLIWIFGGLYGLIYLSMNRDKLNDITSKKLLEMSIIGLFIFLGNIVYWKSSKLNSNPGLNRSIFSTGQILLLTLTSSLLFKAPINMKQVIGIFFVIFGSSIIGYNS